MIFLLHMVEMLQLNHYNIYICVYIYLYSKYQYVLKFKVFVFSELVPAASVVHGREMQQSACCYCPASSALLCART